MFGQHSQGTCRRTKEEMLAYARADRPIATSRKAGHNRLHIRYADGGQAFMLHATCVAELAPCGTQLTLRDGGWATLTTRRAMGDACHAFGLGHLSVWGDRGGHSVNGQHFDREATFTVPGFKIEATSGNDVMLRAVVDGGDSLEVRYDGATVQSGNGDKIEAKPHRVMLELERLLDLARRRRNFAVDPIDYSESLSLFGGAWSANAGQFGRSIRIGCHEFKTADLRAVLRRLQAEYPAEAKRARKLFLASRKAEKPA